MSSPSYDFIIVGGGTSGCFLARRLADAPTKPSVLVIETGGANDDITLLNSAERFQIAFTRDIAHNYVVTEERLNGRKLPYPAGRGLGGSSAINFCIFTYGSRADYELWADLTLDEVWRWENIKQRFKRIENFPSDTVPPNFTKYAHAAYEDHGHSGPVAMSWPRTWEAEVPYILQVAEDNGLSINPDHNSGNPIGISMAINSVDQRIRTTSGTIMMKDKPDNLTVMINTTVGRVLFNGARATGVELEDGSQVFGTKEVILSAGFVRSPQLLLLSGVGPRNDLLSHGISVVHNLSGVGKNLRDHPLLFLSSQIGVIISDRESRDQGTASTRQPAEQFFDDETGYYETQHASQAICFAKDNSIFDTLEFKTLDIPIQTFLKDPTIPHFEFTAGCSSFFPVQLDPGTNCLFTPIIISGSQSCGEVKLQSSSRKVPPIVNWYGLGHPFDQRLIVHAIRQTWKFHKKFPKWQKFLVGPKSDNEEDILDYAKENLSVACHGNGTLSMGQEEDNLTCVDKDFRVHGLRSLRVVDASVFPTTPSGHTQAPSYLVADIAAEKLINEYEL